ncbi:hypothetical protein BDFB_011200 [Asbolus verrucosus]|uniref:Uncharacterized protein n=1 Tax=Asbolus verrucosus TaxID=1661398 RepID=A0A482W471_ASBVE|nr:hypothetical protein BDFB_011200 [Asbolus verrucosus]
MNVPITHDITSGSQRMYMHECCIASVTVDRTPALQPEVRLMHPQSTVDQLPYQLDKDFSEILKIRVPSAHSLTPRIFARMCHHPAATRAFHICHGEIYNPGRHGSASATSKCHFSASSGILETIRCGILYTHCISTEENQLNSFVLFFILCHVILKFVDELGDSKQ